MIQLHRQSKRFDGNSLTARSIEKNRGGKEPTKLEVGGIWWATLDVGQAGQPAELGKRAEPADYVIYITSCFCQVSVSGGRSCGSCTTLSVSCTDAYTEPCQGERRPWTPAEAGAAGVTDEDQATVSASGADTFR